MTLQEVVLAFKNKNHYTIDDIANLVGVNRGTVSRWCTGEITSVRYDTAEKLSQYVGVDVNAMLRDERAKYYRPVVGTVKAGYGLDAEELIEGYEEVSRKEYDQGDFFLRVSGDSMINARICDGDLLYVKKCNTIENGAIAVVLIGNEATVKRVYFKDNLVILEAANPLYETHFYTPQEVEELPVQIIGKVIYTKIMVNGY